MSISILYCLWEALSEFAATACIYGYTTKFPRYNALKIGILSRKFKYGLSFCWFYDPQEQKLGLVFILLPNAYIAM